LEHGQSRLDELAARGQADTRRGLCLERTVSGLPLEPRSALWAAWTTSSWPHGQSGANVPCKLPSSRQCSSEPLRPALADKRQFVERTHAGRAAGVGSDHKHKRWRDRGFAQSSHCRIEVGGKGKQREVSNEAPALADRHGTDMGDHDTGSRGDLLFGK
jgi:hypothetical protein